MPKPRTPRIRPATRTSGRLLATSQQFQYGLPTTVARLVVETPRGWEIDVARQGEGVPVEPAVAEIPGGVRRTWEMRDLPALRDEPLEGRGCRQTRHGREHQTSGLGSVEGQRRELLGPKILDDQDVRLFATGRSDRRDHRVLAADLTLTDEGTLGLVDEIDLRLGRDDVIAASAIDQVDERGEERGFSAAAGAGHQDQAVGLAAECLHFR